MFKFILFLTLVSFQTLGAVNDGQKITQNTFNNSLFQVGDIKQSLLTEVQFQNLHGACWVLMDGRVITSSDYANKISATLPDGRGVFLRSKQNGRADGKGNPSEMTLGTVQDRSSNNLYQLEYSPYQPNSSLVTVSEDGDWSSFLTLAASGGNYARPFRAQNRGGESRPDNLTINYFIKVNANCP